MQMNAHCYGLLFHANMKQILLKKGLAIYFLCASEIPPTFS